MSPARTSPHKPATGLLVSVRTAQEAALALAGGADLIDAKEPRSGALGALPPAVVAQIVAAVGGRAPVSATTGDLPLEPALLAPAIAAMAASGVDYVKIGLFGPPDPLRLAHCLDALRDVLAAPPAGRGIACIAVLMADQGGLDWPLATLARHGFAGAMLDTAGKRAGRLPQLLDQARLRDFVQAAQGLGLLAGLAGSLAALDIAPLRALGPDYLGFRSAVCGAGERTGSLDAGRLALLRAALGRAYAKPGRRPAAQAR